MANLSKIKQNLNVQLHIEKSFEIIDFYLPASYTKNALAICKKKGILVTEKQISMIKNKRGTKDINYVKILKVLVEIAQENKTNIEVLDKSLIT